MYTITCDRCGAKKDYTELSTPDGWSYTRGKDLCPRCFNDYDIRYRIELDKFDEVLDDFMNGVEDER